MDYPYAKFGAILVSAAMVLLCGQTHMDIDCTV